MPDDEHVIMTLEGLNKFFFTAAPVLPFGSSKHKNIGPTYSPSTASVGCIV